MICSAKRKVLDGLNKRYIYGRVVCLMPLADAGMLSSSNLFTAANPTVIIILAFIAHDHFPRRDGSSSTPRGQI